MKRVKLLEAVKGLDMSADELKLIEKMEAAINDALPKDDGEVDKRINEALKAANIKVGDRNLEDVLREIGETRDKALDAVTKNMDIAGLVEKAMPEIEKVYKAREGTWVGTVQKAAAIMTTSNTVDYSTNSVSAEVLESFSLARYAAKRYGRQYVGDLVDMTTESEIQETKIWYEEGDFEGAYAVVSEGNLKPLVSAKLVRNISEAKKIAGKYVYTEEFAKFRKEAKKIIERIIRDQLVRAFYAQLVTAINSASVGYTMSSLDNSVANPNDFDAIVAMVAQAQSIDFNPNVIVIHPVDIARLRLTKAGDDHYVFPVASTSGATGPLELNVIVSSLQTIGTVTIAESGLFKVEAEAIKMRVGYGLSLDSEDNPEHDFDHNRFRVILEVFFHAFLPSPYSGSIVRASLATVKAALEKPEEGQ